MAEVKGSILDTTKKILGMESDYVAFDLDIITHINSVFFEFQQLGIGPEKSFYIEDNATTWAEFIQSDDIGAVKSLMALKVRLLFDPPTTSFHLKAMEDQITKLEWRLNVQMEGVRHPSTTTLPTATHI